MKSLLTGLLVGGDPVVLVRGFLDPLEVATVVVGVMRDADARADTVTALEARLDALELSPRVVAVGTGSAFRDVVEWVILHRKAESRQFSLKAAPGLIAPLFFRTHRKTITFSHR